MLYFQIRADTGNQWAGLSQDGAYICQGEPIKG